MVVDIFSFLVFLFSLPELLGLFVCLVLRALLAFPLRLIVRRSQLLDLLDQVGLFVVELLVLGPIRVEFREEVDELLLVAQQDVQDRLRLVGVGHEHLQQRSISLIIP